jgi:hypothetical protein
MHNVESCLSSRSNHDLEIDHSLFEIGCFHRLNESAKKNSML